MRNIKLFISIAVFLIFFGYNASASSSTTGGFIVDWITIGGSNFTGYGTTATTAAVGNDGRLSDARTPLTHTMASHSDEGTMSTQNSDAISISGGAITGITDLAIDDGGTGASTAADARGNLGALYNVSQGNNVTITWTGCPNSCVATINAIGGGGGGGVSGSGTQNELSYWTGSTSIGTLPVASYPSLTETSYVKGVTSGIQTQINGKAATSHTMASHSDDGTMATQDASDVAITGGDIKIPTGTDQGAIPGGTNSLMHSAGIYARNSPTSSNNNNFASIAGEVTPLSGYTGDAVGIYAGAISALNTHALWAYNSVSTAEQGFNRTMMGSEIDLNMFSANLSWDGSSNWSSTNVAGIGQVVTGLGINSTPNYFPHGIHPLYGLWVDRADKDIGVSWSGTPYTNWTYGLKIGKVETGININQANNTGIEIIQAKNTGIEIIQAGNVGLFIRPDSDSVNDAAIIVSNAANNIPNGIFNVRNNGHVSAAAMSIGYTNTSTLNTSGIFSVIQNSATDPIADSWTVYVSDTKHKNVKAPITTNESKYINQTLSWKSSVWTRKAIVSDDEVYAEFGKPKQEISELEAYDERPRKIETLVRPFGYNPESSNISIINKTTGELIGYNVTYKNESFYITAPGKFKKGASYNETTKKFYKEIDYYPIELEAKRQIINDKKSKLPKFTSEHVGGLLDDPNVPSEIVLYDEHGNKIGYDLSAFILYQQEVIRELAVKVDKLENGKK